MKIISLYIIVFLIIISCKKEQVKPIGQTVDYTTNTDKSQVFKYYFDDGEYVADGLDQYLAALYTEKGTFINEQLLLMTYKIKSIKLPDSILPFTYILGTNYISPLNKNIKFHINTDYPYNNNAHKDYTEVQFFKEHINDMILYKFEIDENENYYYDPNITLIEYPFEIDENTNDIIFNTNDINSSYALCWREKNWEDSIYFSIQNGSESNILNIIEKGYKNTTNNEGALVKNNILYLTYSESKIYSQEVTNQNGWTIYDLYIKIDNPLQGIIQNNNINIDILLKDKNELLTNLLLTDNTNIEIIKFPNFDERGKLKISGLMYIQSSQQNVIVDLEINFYRQR